MPSTFLVRALVSLCTAALVAVACTSENGNGGNTPSNGKTEPTGGSPTSPDVTIPISPTPRGSETFSYSGSGVAALLVVKGASGILTVRNQSGGEVGPPALYVLLAADGKRLDAVLEGAKVIGDGADSKVRVTFPDDFDIERVGIVGLVLGGQDYGALIPESEVAED